ncbi:hypothetical protein HY065_00760 [Candidatus Berkelbacteria bacterium]|nr:hypothetical protein [Candidatus Berkelbacteria bacterium]
MKPVVVIVGKTASGKTACAKRVAEQFGGDVISADSRQVYQYFDIGTAKDLSFHQHLISILDPTKERWTVGDFLAQTRALIDRAHAAGRLPIVVGGTGLYIDALLRGYHLPPGKLNRGQFKGHATPLPYQFLIIGMRLPTDVLYQNIAHRSHDMVTHGLIEETKRILTLLPKNHELLKTIGYKQTIAYLDGKITLADLPAAITKATKVYARHQGNWLKRWPVMWFNLYDLTAIERAVQSCLLSSNKRVARGSKEV